MEEEGSKIAGAAKGGEEEAEAVFQSNCRVGPADVPNANLRRMRGRARRAGGARVGNFGPSCPVRTTPRSTPRSCLCNMRYPWRSAPCGGRASSQLSACEWRMLRHSSSSPLVQGRNRTRHSAVGRTRNLRGPNDEPQRILAPPGVRMEVRLHHRKHDGMTTCAASHAVKLDIGV